MGWFTIGWFGVEGLITAGDPLRQQIFDAVVTRLQTILVAGGYKTNTGSNIFPWRDEGIPDEKRPAIELRDVDVETEEDTIGEVEHRLQIQLSLNAAEGSTSDDQLRDMVSDVKKAVGVDVQWSGLAQDTELIVIMPTDMEKLAKNSSSATMTIVPIYTTDRHSDFAPA